MAIFTKNGKILFSDGKVATDVACCRDCDDKVLWLIPSSLPGYSPIDVWTDQTTPQENAVQATSSAQPAKVNPIVSTYAGARYDGSDDTMVSPLSLPLPWTLVIAGKFPTKPSSPTYILGNSTGGIRLNTDGTVSVVLSGSAATGTTDITQSIIDIIYDFDFKTLTLPDTIDDRSGEGTRIKCDETLANGGTRYEVPPWYADGGQGRNMWYWMVQSGALTSYGTKDFSFSVEALTEGIADLTQKGYGGVDMLMLVVMSDGSNVSIGKRHNNSGSNFRGDYYRFNSGTFQLIQSGEFDTDTTFELRRNGNSLEAWYGGVLKGTGATSAGATIDYVYLNISNGGGWALSDLPGNTWYGTWRNFLAKDENGDQLTSEGTGPAEWTNIQATVSAAYAANIYLKGVSEASGTVAAGTLPSITVIEAGLEADVTEVQAYSSDKNATEIGVIAADLAKYS